MSSYFSYFPCPPPSAWGQMDSWLTGEKPHFT